MRVCVYGIAKDEAGFIERFMATAREADLVLIGDTGSSDGTPALLEAAGAVVRHVAVRPWRFDDARNAVLALVPDDVDVCVSVDLDEVLSPGWRAILDAEWGDATRGKYRYVWSHDEEGRPAVTFRYDRIHARHGYRWVNPCHETLDVDRIDETVVALSLELHHWPDPAKSRGQYLELLEAGRAERPHDPRSAHYVAREYMLAGRYEEAVRAFLVHVQMPEATWADERASSLRYLGRCYDALGQRREALAAFREAADTAPWCREVLVDLASAAHEREQWDLCYDAATKALLVTDPSSSVIVDPVAWGERAHDLASVAAWHLGRRDEALALARDAAARRPGDARLAGNVAWIAAHVDDPAPDA